MAPRCRYLAIGAFASSIGSTHPTIYY